MLEDSTADCSRGICEQQDNGTERLLDTEGVEYHLEVPQSL